MSVRERERESVSVRASVCESVRGMSVRERESPQTILEREVELARFRPCAAQLAQRNNPVPATPNLLGERSSRCRVVVVS
jgi:hypothetical protein